MAINKIEVNLTVSNLVNDLNEGYTWLKKDDLGYGSIEAKYGANPNQIATFRKHPSLKDADTTVKIFNIIDDTKNEVKNETKLDTTRPSTIGTNSNREQPTVLVANRESTVVSNEAADIFANL